MKPKSTALVVVLISLLGFATPGMGQEVSGDSSAIRNLVARYVHARDTGDPAVIRELFTPDADQLVSSGVWRKGQKDVVDGTVASSQSEKGQRRSIDVESVRFLSPDVAIADGRYTLSGGASGTRNMWTAIIAKRTSDGWRIAAIRNMLPAPAR